MLFSVMMNVTTRTGAGVPCQALWPSSRCPPSPSPSPPPREQGAKGSRNRAVVGVRGTPNRGCWLRSVPARPSPACPARETHSVHTGCTLSSATSESGSELLATSREPIHEPLKTSLPTPWGLQERFASDWVHSSLALQDTVEGNTHSSAHEPTPASVCTGAGRRVSELQTREGHSRRQQGARVPILSGARLGSGCCVASAGSLPTPSEDCLSLPWGGRAQVWPTGASCLSPGNHRASIRISRPGIERGALPRCAGTSTY